MKTIYCPICNARIFDSPRCVCLEPVVGTPPKDTYLVIKCRRCPNLLSGHFSDKT